MNVSIFDFSRGYILWRIHRALLSWFWIAVCFSLGKNEWDISTLLEDPVGQPDFEGSTFSATQREKFNHCVSNNIKSYTISIQSYIFISSYSIFHIYSCWFLVLFIDLTSVSIVQWTRESTALRSEQSPRVDDFSTLTEVREQHKLANFLSNPQICYLFSTVLDWEIQRK